MKFNMKIHSQQGESHAVPAYHIKGNTEQASCEIQGGNVEILMEHWNGWINRDSSPYI